MDRGLKLFFTGVTGSLGSALASEALRAGVRIVALARDEDPLAARGRIRSALAGHGRLQGEPEVEVVFGDLGRSGLGLGSDSGMKGVSAIVNCAGSTEFRERAAEHNHRVNVEGVRHLLELAGRLHVPFVHLSTAYVAGCRQGTVREDEIDSGQEFHNSYERTKCEAELLIEEWRGRTGLPVTVLRPGIVTGHSRNGHTVRFMTLYDLLQAFDVIAARLGAVKVRVAADPRATKNLVPVDYFARMAWHLLSRGATGTYHLTHPDPPTVEEMCQVCCRLFQTDGIRLVDSGDFETCPPTPAERLYQRANSVYDAYLRAEPHFDRTRTDAALAGSGIVPPRLDDAYFSRLLAVARERNWGRPSRTDSAAASREPVASYFADFLGAKLHQRLIPDLRKLTATFRVVVTGLPGESWDLFIQDGMLESVSRNGRRPQCLFKVDSSAFFDVVSGRLSPQEAFFRRRIDIEGEIDTGLHLAAVLAEFFRKFPFIAETAAGERG